MSHFGVAGRRLSLLREQAGNAEDVKAETEARLGVSVGQICGKCDQRRVLVGR